MAEPGQHADADTREGTELKRLEAARDAHLPPASPALRGVEAAHPPGFAKAHEPPPERKPHRGPQLRRKPGKPGKPGKG